MYRKGIVWLPILIMIAAVGAFCAMAYLAWQVNNPADSETSQLENNNNVAIVSNNNVSTNTTNTNIVSNVNSATNTNAAANTNLISDDNKYTNSTYGYSVEYPRSWSITNQEADFVTLNNDDVVPQENITSDTLTVRYQLTAVDQARLSETHTVLVDGIESTQGTLSGVPNETVTYVKRPAGGYLRISWVAFRGTSIHTTILSSLVFSETVSDWKTYTNDTYGYSIQYPIDWSISEVNATITQILPPDAEEKSTIERSPAVVIDASVATIGSSYQNRRTVTINGLSATRALGGEMYETDTTFFSRGDKYLSVAWPSFFSADYSEYDQILSRFEFSQ